MSDDLKRSLESIFTPKGSCEELYAALHDSGLDALEFETSDPSDPRIEGISAARKKMQLHCAMTCFANTFSDIPPKICSLDGPNDNPDDEAHFKRVFGAIFYGQEDEEGKSELDYWEY